MFFNCEWPRVEGDAKDRNIGHITGPHFAHGETEKNDDDLLISISTRNKSQKLFITNSINLNGRGSDEKDLIDTREKDSPDKANGPCAKSRRRHPRIVSVGNSSPDFEIWGFILEECGGGIKVRIVEIIEREILHVVELMNSI
jgi:hypothetical protein